MRFGWFAFAISAAIFWGAYVVTIAYGQAAFGGRTSPNASMRAFLFIGLAYFLLAILVPGIWLLMHPMPAGDTGFNWNGALLCTLAGALGAAGALAVTFALKYGGTPTYVAPIVFTGAPIINVLLAFLIASLKGQAESPKPLFFLGLILAVAGTALVLLNSPTAHGSPSKPAAHSPATTTSYPATKP